MSKYIGRGLSVTSPQAYSKVETDARYKSISAPSTAGMVFGLDTDGTTGALTVTRGVTSTTDGNGDQLYDVTIVGTDDMSFTVDDNGHLIMSIS